jgi:hypothetical protein
MNPRFDTIFELGVTDDGIAVKVLDWEKAVDFTPPIYLAAFTLALYDTVLNKLPDSEQITFQTIFLKSINHMIKKKDKYDHYIKHKNIINNDDEEFQE